MTNENNIPTIFEGTVVQETEDYQVVQLSDGKFKKQMKYKKFFSKIPTTDEEIKELYRVLNDENNNDIVSPMSQNIDKELEIHQVYIVPYESFDEDTGFTEKGVTSTIYDGGHYYATSSKSVYHTLHNLFQVFGYPQDNGYDPIKVRITGTKRERGLQINLSLV